MSKYSPLNYNCNTLVNCSRCEFILIELPQWRKVEKTITSNKIEIESGKFIDYVETNIEYIENIIRLNGWKKLLYGGYVCKTCYDELKELHSIEEKTNIGLI